MKASNAILSWADPKSVDIEHVAETEDQYIEMVHFTLPIHVVHISCNLTFRTSAYESSRTAKSQHCIPTLALIWRPKTCRCPRSLRPALVVLMMMALTCLTISCCRLPQDPSSLFPNTCGHVLKLRNSVITCLHRDSHSCQFRFHVGYCELLDALTVIHYVGWSIS